MRELLGSHPITRRAVECARTDEPTCIMCLSGAEPETETLASGNMAQVMPGLLRDKACYINLLPPMEWESYLTVLGYDRFPEADSLSLSGMPYHAYKIDLTVENLISKIERILSRLAEQAEPPATAFDPPARMSDTLGIPGGEPDASFRETLDRIGRFLKRYHKLPQYPEYAREFLPLLPTECRGLHDEAIVQALMARTQSIQERLRAGNPEEQRMSRILRYAYIQKIGTHEAAAELLDIPVPSYYRYLRAAVRRFAFEWINLP